MWSRLRARGDQSTNPTNRDPQESSPTHEVSRQDRIQPATLIRVRVCKRVRRVHALAQGTQAQSMTTGCPSREVTRSFHATLDAGYTIQTTLPTVYRPRFEPDPRRRAAATCPEKGEHA